MFDTKTIHYEPGDNFYVYSAGRRFTNKKCSELEKELKRLNVKYKLSGTAKKMKEKLG